MLEARRDVQECLAPTIVTSRWDDRRSGAKRFDRFSQRAWPLVLGLGAAIDFQNSIGRERIEQRARNLASRLRSRLEGTEGVTIHTSSHPELHCALTGFSLDRFVNHEVVEPLFDDHRLRVRSTGYGLNTVRVSTHYYNSEDQVERLSEALQEIRLRRGHVVAARV